MNYKRILKHYAYTLQGWLKDINGYRVVVNTPNLLHNIRYTYSADRNRLSSINVTGTGIGSSSYQYDALGNLIRDNNENINVTWNVIGKVKSVQTPNNMLNFAYNPFGQRQIKRTASDSTYYIHDATGNVMSIYVKDYPKITAKERPIYGSSRLGIMNKEVEFNLTGNFLSKSNSTIGIKEYELCDHLSNVSVVILDRKDCFNSVFKPIVKTYTDYYPFGYPISSRTDNVNYRYGYNGQEGDDEIYGDNLDYAFKYRMYDARIGRFWSVDPLRNDYPWNSTYAFAENSPIAFFELEGLEKIYFWSQNRQKKVFSHVENKNIKEWVVISTNLYNSFTYTFTNESKFNKWGSSPVYPLFPIPRELSSGVLWETMKEMFGDPAQSGLNIMDIQDNINFLLQNDYINKLDDNYSFGVVIGSFRDLKYAESFVKNKYPQAIILRFETKSKDKKTTEIWYRVVTNIDKYSNFVNVLDDRNKRKDEGIKDAWMTIIPNEALKSGNYSSKDGQEKIENLFKKK